jgi:two-component system LytT family response regulator
MRALIVDDEPLARRRLRRMLGSIADVQVVGEAIDGLHAIAQIRALRPDLVFLDVQMPGADGFDVLAAVGHDRIPAVIFVTAFDAHAMKAFDVYAVDYLLKPFSPGRLQKSLERCCGLLQRHASDSGMSALAEDVHRQRPLQRLVAPDRGRLVVIDTRDVIWVESAGHYVIVAIASGRTFLMRGSLERLTRRLDAALFIRIHRRWLIRVDAVREFEPTSHGDYRVRLVSGRRLPVSRRYAAALIERLSD